MKGDVDDDDYDDEHIDKDGGWCLFHVCTKASGPWRWDDDKDRKEAEMSTSGEKE